MSTEGNWRARPHLSRHDRHRLCRAEAKGRLDDLRVVRELFQEAAALDESRQDANIDGELAPSLDSLMMDVVAAGRNAAIRLLGHVGMEEAEANTREEDA